MNIFITGATGFVGREIVRQAHAAGHSVRILARHPDAASVRDLVSRYGVEVSRGDVTQPGTLSPALDGVEGVLNLVGIISEAGQSTFENIHTRGTGNVVAAGRQAGIRRFIQMSALGVRPKAASRYHQTKWAAEEIVRGSGLEFTIFRPSLIFGPGDHFVNLFEKISRFSPLLPVMGSGRSRFQPVAVEAVAAAFIGALREPGSMGQTYDLCGPDTLTLPQMLDAILAAAGRRRFKLRVPLGLARCQAAMLEFAFPRLLGKAPPLNRDQLTMLEEDNVGNAAPANELFGLPQVGFREGIGYVKRET
jgi:NADH dehydrogenase